MARRGEISTTVRPSRQARDQSTSSSRVGSPTALPAQLAEGSQDRVGPVRRGVDEEA